MANGVANPSTFAYENISESSVQGHQPVVLGSGPTYAHTAPCIDKVEPVTGPAGQVNVGIECLRRGLYVVRELTMDPAALAGNSTRHFAYQYRDGQRDMESRAFLGFREQITTDLERSDPTRHLYATVDTYSLQQEIVAKTFDDGSMAIVDDLLPMPMLIKAGRMLRPYVYARATCEGSKPLPFKVRHFCLGGRPLHLRAKLEGNGHARDIDAEKYLQIWLGISPEKTSKILNNLDIWGGGGRGWRGLRLKNGEKN